MLNHSFQRMGMYFLDDEIPISRNGGTIPDIEDIELLSQKIIDFLDKYNQTDIDNYNKRLSHSIYNYYSSSPKEKKPHRGYVYLVKGENNRYKIGCSKNPKKRIESLRLSSCENHIFIHSYCVDDMYTEEQRLHHKFTDYRCHSEWFDLPSEAIDYIMGLK